MEVKSTITLYEVPSNFIYQAHEQKQTIKLECRSYIEKNYVYGRVAFFLVHFMHQNTFFLLNRQKILKWL